MILNFNKKNNKELIIKNVSSSTYISLKNYGSTFRNVNIMKIQIFYKMKYDLKGHIRPPYYKIILAHLFMDRF